ncbi:MAG: dihydropteroate synthase [Thiobacillaceae bacterium]
MNILQAGRYQLDLSRPLIMGVVNVTPDSFSDGGRLATSHAAVAHALNLREQGADIVDIGGESTRPGAAVVEQEEEWRRISPVLEALVAADVPVSVDTRKPAVMRAAIEAGAAMINDVQALRAPGALETVARGNVAVCLMHMQGQPRNMQEQPVYDDVVAEVRSILAIRVEACEKAGIKRDRIVVDPGFGFGKTLDHNLALLRHLDSMVELGLPVLVGISRKTMLGALTGRPVDQREYAGVAANLLALARGASIVRVHDVAAMRDALSIWNAVEGER